MVRKFLKNNKLDDRKESVSSDSSDEGEFES